MKLSILLILFISVITICYSFIIASIPLLAFGEIIFFGVIIYLICKRLIEKC